MFKNEFPNALKLMHLTKDQISEMIDMGHTIGTHSHSHISLGSSRLTKKEILSELIGPQKYLNDFFGIDSKFISYPFGDIRDCLKSKQLLKLLNKCKFSVSNDETRHYLSGIYFHQTEVEDKNYLTAVATAVK